MRLLTMTLALGLLAAEARAQIEFRGELGPLRIRAGQVPTEYQFGARKHMDELADALRKQMKSICLEMHYHYRENPGFRETYAEAYAMWQASEHVHQLVHEQEHGHGHGPADVDHIASDLEKLDGLFHHVEEDVARWQPGHRVARGHDLHALMEQAEESLHHIMDDYGSRSKFRKYGTDEPPAPEPVPPRPAGR